MEQTMALSTYIYLKSISILTKIWTTINLNWFVSILLAIISYFEPIHMMLGVVIFAVFTDTLTGILASLKQKRKITSWRLRDTVIKLLTYILLIMLMYALDTECLYSFIPLQNIISGFIIFAEAVSIAENTDIISNKKLGLATFVKKIRSKWFKNNDIK